MKSRKLQISNWAVIGMIMLMLVFMVGCGSNGKNTEGTTPQSSEVESAGDSGEVGDSQEPSQPEEPSSTQNPGQSEKPDASQEPRSIFIGFMVATAIAKPTTTIGASTASCVAVTSPSEPIVHTT